MGQSALIGILYVLASLICVSLSAYATARGFESILGEGAIFAAAAIGIGLMVCNIVLLRLVQLKKKLGAFVLPFLALCFFAAFSSVSNFTYFYSLVMDDVVSANRFAQAERTFDANVRVAENELARRNGFTQRREEVENLLRRLEMQVASVQEPGFGPKALEHLEDIYTAVPISRLRPPPVGASTAANQNWLNGFRPIVMSELDQLEQQDPVALAARQVGEIKRQGLEVTAAVSATPRPTVAQMQAAVRNLEDRTHAIENIVVQAAQRTGDPAEMSLVATDFHGMDLFNVNYVFESAFVRRESVGIAILTGAFAIFIDFIPLLIACVIATLSGPGVPAKRRRKKGRYTVLDGEEYAGG